MVSFLLFQQDLTNIPVLDGLNAMDVLLLPESVASLLRHIMRQDGCTVQEIGKKLDFTDEEAQQVIEVLTGKGYLEETFTCSKQKFKVHMTRMRPRNIPLDI